MSPVHDVAHGPVPDSVLHSFDRKFGRFAGRVSFNFNSNYFKIFILTLPDSLVDSGLCELGGDVVDVVGASDGLDDGVDRLCVLPETNKN